ncbi:hypothetical protein BH10PSE12_BH10PSE12_01860 [soil metagenome]
MRRAAAFTPASYREADNSIELCWSVGAAGTRFDWMGGEFYTEELSMDPKAVRLGRLNDGAPLLDSHQDHSLDSVIGSVTPGSARIANGQGLCRVRLAHTPDVANTVAKIVDGHIRNVSVGYIVHEYLKTESSTERTHMLATDWEPAEISMVCVPFDAAAQVRSRSRSMPDPIDPNDDHIDEADAGARRRAGAARAVTVARIRDVCGRTDDYSRAFERSLLEDHAESPLSDREFSARLADELIRVREQPGVNVRGGGRDTVGQMARGMEDAIFARLSGTAPTEAAQEYRGASMIDMARGLFEAHGERVRWASKSEIARRVGNVSTSDFANLLGSAAQRFLRAAYEASPSPMLALAARRTVPDFRQINALQLAGPAVLRQVEENGEFKRVNIIEGLNGYRLATYGEIFGITRQALINDDLGGFQQLARFWLNAEAETEAQILVSNITGFGANVIDVGSSTPIALYNAAHGNLATTGTAITVAALAAGRQAMREQKQPGGVIPANIVPKYLLVGPAKETEAETILTTLASAEVAQVNPFSGKLQLIVDPHLTGNSWRLFADPAASPVLEYAQLEGQEGLFTDTRVGFEVDGVEFKARIDFGAGLIDWRGTYLNPGN